MSYYKSVKCVYSWWRSTGALQRKLGTQMAGLSPTAKAGAAVGVSELVFGPYAALASSFEMLMYNTYTALSDTFTALPTNQILPSDQPPRVLTQPHNAGAVAGSGYAELVEWLYRF